MRKMTGSTSKYSPSPPQTPATTLSVRLRSSRRLGGAAGGVSFGGADMARSWGSAGGLPNRGPPDPPQGRDLMRMAVGHGIIRRLMARTDQRRLYRSSDDRILAGVCG